MPKPKPIRACIAPPIAGIRRLLKAYEADGRPQNLCTDSEGNFPSYAEVYASMDKLERQGYKSWPEISCCEQYARTMECPGHPITSKQVKT